MFHTAASLNVYLVTSIWFLMIMGFVFQVAVSCWTEIHQESLHGMNNVPVRCVLVSIAASSSDTELKFRWVDHTLSAGHMLTLQTRGCIHEWMEHPVATYAVWPGSTS